MQYPSEDVPRIGDTLVILVDDQVVARQVMKVLRGIVPNIPPSFAAVYTVEDVDELLPQFQWPPDFSQN